MQVAEQGRTVAEQLQREFAARNAAQLQLQQSTADEQYATARRVSLLQNQLAEAANQSTRTPPPVRNDNY